MSFKPIIEVGFDKNGEADYRVNATGVNDLGPVQFNALLVMVTAAIYGVFQARGEFITNDNAKTEAQSGVCTDGRTGQTRT